MIRVDRTRLRKHRYHDALLHILESALSAINPETLLSEALKLEGHGLTVRGRRYDLKGRRVGLLAIGKAAAVMARGVERALGNALSGGIAITRSGYGVQTQRVRVIESGHPIPDSCAGAEAVRAWIEAVGPSDVVLCALSGGGSALLTALPDSVSLLDWGKTTALLIGSGATIDEINTIRRHVSTLQGGRLMEQLAPAQVITLLLSDVIGDRIESIASGPTAPDPTTYDDAMDVLQRFDLWKRVPRSVSAYLERGSKGHYPETPKPGDPIFRTSATHLLGSNHTAVEAAAEAARGMGFHTVIVPEPLQGEAREVGHALAERARALSSHATAPWALVGGGETTVALKGSGQGGRNQELALAAAQHLDQVPDIVFAALATDGTDGSTEAAGAVVDGETANRAASRGHPIPEALAVNDSHAALAASNDLLWTGPTGTNVADVCVALGGVKA